MDQYVCMAGVKMGEETSDREPDGQEQTRVAPDLSGASSGPPIVVAVCVTGKTPFHVEHLLPAAVRSFAHQDYPADRRHLLLVSDTPASMVRIEACCEQAARERGFLWSAIAASGPLGRLRNTGLDIAQQHEQPGHLVIQWDDDDWSRADRISVQVAAYLEGPEPRPPCFLARQMVYDFTTGTAGVRQFDHTFIHGTILHENRPVWRYPTDRDRSEDTEFLRHWADSQGHIRATVLDNDPMLYWRTFHGGNTWDRDMILRQWAEPWATGGLWLPESRLAEVRRFLTHYQSLAKAQRRGEGVEIMGVAPGASGVPASGDAPEPPGPPTRPAPVLRLLT